ncbi:uncharacterized protein LOC129603646 [Betta splendens]|uniref:Uncharacterized protein LOC129603646 n=1 Tax=Betta splendens TaxID=158456 RepID=A0A9W2XK19_BETSP|nr:uncharacterized protein LOC129603646 [Betta splendens]
MRVLTCSGGLSMMAAAGLMRRYQLARERPLGSPVWTGLLPAIVSPLLRLLDPMRGHGLTSAGDTEKLQIMDHRPLFRVQPSSTELTLRPSPEALTVAQAYHGSEAWKVKVPQKVKEEAQARTLQGGGDPHCSQLLLSQYEIQFGQYRGQTFKWLLSHDVGYAVSLLASHQKERESGDTSSSPLMANKDALTSYSKLFPEVMSAVEGRRATEGSKSVRSQDKKLVEFGPHGAMTYASMYEATGKEVET